MDPFLAQLAQDFFAAATFIAALGAFAVAWRNRTRADRATRAAEAAAAKAEAAKLAAEDSNTKLVAIGDSIYELGKQIDGRMSDLLKASEARGKAEGRALHAEGVVQGEQAERERTTNGDVK